MIKQKCTECKKKCIYLFDCSFCGKGFCTKHRYFESHICLPKVNDISNNMDIDTDEEKFKKAVDEMKCVASKIHKI